MATKKTGPIKGVRVPVKLPWKSVAHDEEQFVSMKKPVAEWLKLDSAKKTDLIYSGTIYYKDRDKDGNPTGSLKSKKVSKTRRPGYRTRGIRVIFGDRKTGERKPYSGVDKVKRSSVQFPITQSISITEIRDEFMTGQWKNFPVVRIEDANSGQGYPIY